MIQKTCFNVIEKDNAQDFKLANEKKKVSASIFDKSAKTAALLPIAGIEIGHKAVTDWINDNDKISTDGKDDGNINWKQKILSFIKGLGGIIKTAVNNPMTTGLVLAGGIGLTVATSGAILPAMVTLGVGTGIISLGYGGYKAATAKTDGEAKAAWETIGEGVFAIATSALGAKSAFNTVRNAGILSSETSNFNIAKATIQCIKSTPESLVASGKNIVSNSKNVINTITEDRNNDTTPDRNNNNTAATTNNTNYTATRTAGNGTLLGMNATTWTWIISLTIILKSLIMWWLMTG